MKVGISSAISLVVAVSMAATAQANTADFTFSGAGVSGSGTFTYTVDAGGVGSITGVTGLFSDGNTGLHDKPVLLNVPITGIVPINPITPLPAAVLAPDFSQFNVANGVEGAGEPSTAISFDNNLYLDGSPVVCLDYPFSGGFLDVYGVAFTLQSGQVVDLWSNGNQPDGLNYGVALVDSDYTYDYVNGVSASIHAVPLPMASWMGTGMLAGLAGLSLLRKRLHPCA